MPPILPNLIAAGSGLSQLFTRSEFTDVRSQWQNPADILSVLLILGGDVVQTAVAQLSGGPFYFAPVAFSFGWVAYSISAVLTTLGDNRLMPKPDRPSVIINAKSGYKRPNECWLLARMMHDWKESDFDRDNHALCVTIHALARGKKHGVPIWDMAVYSGVIVIVVQCIIAAIPGILYGFWEITIITVCGTLLSLVQSSLPEWRREKWPGRRLPEKSKEIGAKRVERNASKKTVCLTAGNGSNLVIVIISNGEGFDLESLATGSVRLHPDRLTKLFTIIFALLWLVLLLTVAGVKQNGWFLLMVGALGMLQNIFAAGMRRDPSALGIHLQRLDCIVPSVEIPNKTMAVLKNVALKYPLVATCLLDEFFPGGNLRPEETVFWHNIRKNMPLQPDSKATPVHGSPVFRLEVTPPKVQVARSGSGDEAERTDVEDRKSQSTGVINLGELGGAAEM